jgi:hypothetical protein
MYANPRGGSGVIGEMPVHKIIPDGMKTKRSCINIIKYTVNATRTVKRITYFRGV